MRKTVISETATVVRFNGFEQGTVEGANFGMELLRIRLGRNPQSDDLENGMLGAG
jgi:hypothetical protein